MAKSSPGPLCISIVSFPSGATNLGVGKSCICNRLMELGTDDFTPDKHKSTISQSDFVGSVVNQSVNLYIL